MEQTAVEWLVEHLPIEGRKTLINQAKSIENQRIFDAQVNILSEQIVKEKEKSYSEEDMKEAYAMGRLNKSIKDFNEKFNLTI